MAIVEDGVNMVQRIIDLRCVRIAASPTGDWNDPVTRGRRRDPNSLMLLDFGEFLTWNLGQDKKYSEFPDAFAAWKTMMTEEAEMK